MAEWRNWSGSVVAAPQTIASPRTEAELSALVAGARNVRVAGAGHSFMPLCETDDLLLSLADMEGGIEVSADRQSLWAPAGLSIRNLTKAMWDQGLSLANQGDINKQAIAGALATATHGTGRTLGSLATQACAYRLVLADGQVVEVDAASDRDLYEAQRVSLGMLGVMSRVKLNVVPAFHLKETNRRRPLKEVLESWDTIADEHRHAEFWNFPYSEHVIFKTLEVVDGGGDGEDVSSDAVFQAVCDLVALSPRFAPTLQRILTRAAGRMIPPRAGPAWAIFPSERAVRFEEMEYEIPAANGIDALQAAIKRVRDSRFPIIFPFEFRTVAGDDIWLSPMHAGPCVSISFHQYAKMDWRPAFAAVEEVFRAHGGRPHWAKRHTLGSDDVLALYPNATRWGEVRKRADPAGKFMNAHLRQLFAFSL